MLVSELLRESILLEKLGNLRSLNVGSMINILRQRVGGGKHGNTVTRADSNFGTGYGKGLNNSGGFGSASEIVDVGVIRGGIGGLRKAYKAHEDAIAFALYVDGKAVCFGKFSEYDLAGSSRAGVFAYDLTAFKDQIDKENETAKAKAPSWYSPEEKAALGKSMTSYKEKEPREWEKRNAEKAGRKIRNEIYHGEAEDTASLKAFIEELIKYAGDKPITCKLVLKDKEGLEKAKKRYNIAMTKDQLRNGLDDLKVRLAKYKISKKPTVDTIESFLEQALKGAGKVIQFGGRGYSTTAESGYGYDKVNPTSVLSGHPFSVRYRTVDPGNYDDVEVFYSFDTESGMLKPFKAKWTDKESKDTQVAALEPETFIKHELGVKKIDKDEILKKILTNLKDGNTHVVKNLIAASRKGGHDYPEFKAIEKSLAASEKKSD